MAYEVRVNHEKIWFQELTAIDLTKVKARDGTEWEALAKQMEQPIITPLTIRRKIQRVAVLRPVVVACWIMVVVAIIMVIVAMGIVITETGTINRAIEDVRPDRENLKAGDNGECAELLSGTGCSEFVKKIDTVLEAENEYNISTWAWIAVTCILAALASIAAVLALSRWSEKNMRDMLRHEVNRVLGSHVPQTHYLLVEQVLLQQPGLHLQRSTVPVNLSVQAADGDSKTDKATFKQLRSSLAQLVKRPGLPLFKVFFVSEEFLQDPELVASLQHYGSHLQTALDEQRLKVLSYIPRSQQQRLCQEIFAEGDAIRDVQAQLVAVQSQMKPGSSRPFS